MTRPVAASRSDYRLNYPMTDLSNEGYLCRLRGTGECLEFALRHPEETEYGVWGGTTPGERRELRKRRPRPKLVLPKFYPTWQNRRR
jgi:hypothetical protein